MNSSIIHSAIAAIDFYLPDNILDNKMLNALFPVWSEDKIYSKTGISKRHIANFNETALDLGIKAAENLFLRNNINRNIIDALFFCTQSPNFRIPQNAALAQRRLGLQQSIAAFDISLGCSGFVYLLSLAKAYIESGQAKNILCLASDTISKDLAEGDKSVRAIFGDAGSAVLIKECNDNMIDNFVFMTDGEGFKDLIIPKSGAAYFDKNFLSLQEFNVDGRTPENFYMNGPAVFQFTLRQVPKILYRCLYKAQKTINDIDYFILHQSNLFMLNHIKKICKIPDEKFIIEMDNFGNTVSSSIPIALKIAMDKDIIGSGDTVMIIGYGIGYSCAACIVKIA